MKNYILGMLYLIVSLTASLQAHQMEDSMSGSMMRSSMMQNMMEVSENDLLSSLNDQEKSIYQQFNPQQKALVLKAANQFSCHAHMQMMRQRMMQQGMNQQGMMNK